MNRLILGSLFAFAAVGIGAEKSESFDSALANAKKQKKVIVLSVQQEN